MPKYWKKIFKNWVYRPLPEDMTLRDVDPEAGFPVILRSLIHAGTSAVVVSPQLSLAEKISEYYPFWAEIAGMKSWITLLPETSDRERIMPENEAQRMKALFAAAAGEEAFFSASVLSFLEEAPPPGLILNGVINLKRGTTHSLKKLVEKLIGLDYDDEIEVNVPGEFSKRGGIIDIFSPNSVFPARIEFFGDEIVTIRKFSPETQRSEGEIDGYTVIPRNPAVSDRTNLCFGDYFESKNHTLILISPEQCRVHVERFGSAESAKKWDSMMVPREKCAIIRLLDVVESSHTSSGNSCGCFSLFQKMKREIPGEISPEYGKLARQFVSDKIREWLSSGYHVVLTGENENGAARIKDWCAENGIEISDIEIDLLPPPSGFVLEEEKLAVITEKELYFMPHSRNIPAYSPTKQPKNVPQSQDKKTLWNINFTDIDEGDYVVHSSYGIGIFNGIREFRENGREYEMILIEFADNVLVHIPTWEADLITRYAGTGKSLPPLSKIGERRWAKLKNGAMNAVKGLAADMLRTQALRSYKNGYAFPEDGHDQHVFEGAFIFPETPDQKKSSEEIKKDMCSLSPMDRLLCGDAGYGKTEIAMRASFRCAMAGRQAAVLVPTTVLAQQHFYTFSERFAEYPVIIEMLSRFKTHSEQKRIIENLGTGKIDIIIGTHRLIQKDITFSNLGLIIIDEEQRFGVEHKERLKHLRATVDILTMTATPIPRTLYLAMTGVRDLSVIMTPPAARLPVQTIVCRQDDKTVQEAITREVQRGGQIFYLHNRVKTIEVAREKLKALVPDANFAVAHGQMPERELEKVMTDFLDGKIDVLVCTTIIESGLDIPNANTIIIERADRFGLADLYQLRERVGRWTRQAYAYLLLPPHAVLEGSVRERISAMRKYTHLGAGFRLAMRDLEIRGAGNILGAEQSGHINNIGFELYCSLLRTAAAELKGGKAGNMPRVEISIDFADFAYKTVRGRAAAALPPDYISSEKLRIDAYRRLAGAGDEKELDAFADELADRYGKLPSSVLNLVLFHKIRVLLAKKGYNFLIVKDGLVKLPAAGSKKAVFYPLPPLIRKKTPDKKLHDLYSFLSESVV